ncbi:hypothetical protein JD969_13740 [Planctomycetota bacterium]|nr:hypothetical protein JD969_13740 [Planctomycetota bacterium]
MNTTESEHKLPPNTYASTRSNDAFYYACRTIKNRPVLYPECRHCHYPINNLTTNTCPECGSNLSKIGYLKPQSKFPILLKLTFIAAALFFALILTTAIFATRNIVYDTFYRFNDKRYSQTCYYLFKNQPTKPHALLLHILSKPYTNKSKVGLPQYTIIFILTKDLNQNTTPTIINHDNQTAAPIPVNFLNKHNLYKTSSLFTNDAHWAEPEPIDQLIIDNIALFDFKPISDIDLAKLLKPPYKIDTNLQPLTKPITDYSINIQSQIPELYIQPDVNVAYFEHPDDLVTYLGRTTKNFGGQPSAFNQYINPSYYALGFLIFNIYCMISLLFYRRLNKNFMTKLNHLHQ